MILRTFHGTNGITTSVPALDSSTAASRPNAAIPWPRRTASLIASQAGKARRRVGTIPISANALSAITRVAEPSSREIQVSDSRSSRDNRLPFKPAVTNNYDLVLDQRLRFNLGRGNKTTSNADFGVMRAHGVYHFR